MKLSSSGPVILLLGTGHWSNPTINYINPQYDDMLAPERQCEIQDCLEQLKRFQPTKVALEAPYERDDELNELYREYRAGTFSLTASEAHQLGFRLAAEMDHDRVYAIDWHDSQREIGWESAIEFARRHNQLELISWIESREQQEAQESRNARTASVREMLLEANDADWLHRNHQIYADLMRVGEGDRYIGVDVVGRWYERNMKIFVNLTRITTLPSDRIFVVIGAGHIPLLRHFIEGSGLYKLEAVEP